MQFIKTRFIGPTNKHDSRYKASCDAGSVTLTSDHRLNPEANHERAARALITKLGWWHDESRGDRYGRWFSGSGKDAGHVFVCGIEGAELKKDGPQ